MSVVSDKIKEVINDQVVGTRKNLDRKVDKVIKGMRSGEGKIDELEEIEIDIITLDEPEKIFPSYEKALNREDGRSTLLVEYGDFYNEK